MPKNVRTVIVATRSSPTPTMFQKPNLFAPVIVEDKNKRIGCMKCCKSYMFKKDNAWVCANPDCRFLCTLDYLLGWYDCYYESHKTHQGNSIMFRRD